MQEYNHLFIVTEGEARIQLGEETVIIHKDEALQKAYELGQNL